MKNLLLLLSLFNVLVIPLYPQNRPFATETAETVGESRVRMELGFAYVREMKYGASGLEGNLFRLADLGARFGVGEKVEIQLFWTAQNFLDITRRWNAPLTERIEFNGDSTQDFGDVIMATKVNVFHENDSRPSLGLRFGTKLPNASHESGLGVDETDFFIAFLLQKRLGKIHLLGNVGLSILGDPTNISSQNDLFDYSIATIVPINSRFNLIADLYGRAGADGFGTEEQSQFRTGGQIRAAGMNWDFGILLGFLETDPEWGLMVGLTKDFSY